MRAADKIYQANVRCPRCQGIAAVFFRQQLGKAADNLAISLSFIPPAACEVDDDEEARA